MRQLIGGIVVGLVLAGDPTPSNHAAEKSFVWSMIQKESSHKAGEVIGDKGKAVGPLQMWTITVDDVNRIGKLRKWPITYTYEDRNDLYKSLDMFFIYSSHYAAHNKDWSAEGIARRWNGGPDGHKQTSTDEYWYDVKEIGGW